MFEWGSRRRSTVDSHRTTSSRPSEQRPQRQKGETVTMKAEIFTQERIGRRKHLTWEEFLFLNSGGTLIGPGELADQVFGRFGDETTRRASIASTVSSAGLPERVGPCPCTRLETPKAPTTKTDKPKK